MKTLREIIDWAKRMGMSYHRTGDYNTYILCYRGFPIITSHTIHAFKGSVNALRKLIEYHKEHKHENAEGS